MWGQTVTAANQPSTCTRPGLLMADNYLKDRENCLDGNFASLCLYLDQHTHTPLCIQWEITGQQWVSCKLWTTFATLYTSQESMSIESLPCRGRSVLRSLGLHATSDNLGSLWAWREYQQVVIKIHCLLIQNWFGQKDMTRSYWLHRYNVKLEQGIIFVTFVSNHAELRWGFWNVFRVILLCFGFSSEKLG